MSISPPAARVPVPIIAAVILLGIDVVTRVIEIPAAVAGVVGPDSDGTAVVAAILVVLVLLVPAALAALAAALLLRRRRGGLIPLALLLLYLLGLSARDVVTDHLEVSILIELVAVTAALVLALVPASQHWLRTRPSVSGPDRDPLSPPAGGNAGDRRV